MRAMKPVMRIKVATNMVPTATGEFWCRLLGQHSMHKSNTAMQKRKICWFDLWLPLNGSYKDICGTSFIYIQLKSYMYSIN